MEDFLITNPWFPARRSNCRRAAPQPSSSPAPNSKIISIPIHDGTERNKIDISHQPKKLDRSSAAVKVQKVFRGFLARKSIRTVQKIATEAEEISYQISKENICSSSKEKMRIGESLMALLLRLDAVRGVREYRKRVIRRVIQLEDSVDTIARAEIVQVPHSNEKNDALSDTEKNGEDGAMAEAVKKTDESLGMLESVKVSTDEAPQMTELSYAEGITAMNEVMERTAAENGGSKRMVRTLCEKSAQQCELMRRLEQRVEQLERRVRMVRTLCEKSAEQCELMSRLEQRVEQLERRVRMGQRRKRLVTFHNKIQCARLK